jgi:uncharacterized protein (DUF433 family)
MENDEVPGFPLLWSSPGRMSGRVCLRGTRIPVYCVLDAIAEYGDAKKAWSYITDMQIYESLRWAARTIEEQ